VRLLSITNGPVATSTGSGYIVSGMAAGLRARGHEVDLLSPADYEPFFGRRRAIRWRQAWGMAGRAVAEVARAEPDVVEIYGGEGWLTAERLLLRRHRRFLFVFHSNGLEPHCEEVLRRAEQAGRFVRGRRWYHLDLSLLHDRAFRRVDGLVVVSDYDRAYALAHGYAGGRVETVRNPLPASFLGRPLDLDRQPWLLYCGSWIPLKGVHRIVSEVPDVLRELPAWRLLLVGVGRPFRKEEHFPADLLPRIEVVPEAEREYQLAGLYQRAAILLLPSLYESFGLVCAEAMAWGCAVAAARVGFPAGLRDGEEVLHVEEQPGCLARSLRRLMGDEDLRRRVAHGGWRRVQSLSWESALSRIEALYASWLTERRTDRRDG
jgi:glycosyltransferase involved in cell wall biosynthesis